MEKELATILVTGSKGQLGRELRHLAPQFRIFKFEYVDVEELDICDEAAVQKYFTSKKFFACINCAAYTAVDKAETEADIAHKVNVTGAIHLSVECKKRDIPLINISTDYVYHGAQNLPYKEGDPVNPQGVYAQTKLAGDKVVLTEGGMVIRTSWLYSAFGNNFVKTMLRLGAEREELKIIFDQIGTPTWARDLAQTILQILEGYKKGNFKRKNLSGIYHYSNEGVCSWYDFAVAIFLKSKMTTKVIPIETKDYPTAASRPPFSVLNKAKIKRHSEFRSRIGRKVLRHALRKCGDLVSALRAKSST